MSPIPLSARVRDLERKVELLQLELKRAESDITWLLEEAIANQKETKENEELEADPTECQT